MSPNSQFIQKWFEYGKSVIKNQKMGNANIKGKNPWLLLIIISSVVLIVAQTLQFILSRFTASTMELMMKMMRGTFLSMFLRDVLGVAIQSAVLLLLLGAGVGMFLFFRKVLREDKKTMSKRNGQEHENQVG